MGQPQKRLRAVTRNSLGIVFAVADSMLWKVDALRTSGHVWTPVVRLQRDGAPVSLHGLCFSQWLERGEVLYGLLSHVDGAASSSVCRVDVASGAVRVICHLNKGTVDALVSPPLTGGPWNGLVFMFWSRGQGLFGVSWANEHFNVRPLIVGQGVADAGIRGLAFDASDTLFGAGSSLWQLSPFEHSLVRLGTLNNLLSSFCFVDAGSEASPIGLGSNINSSNSSSRSENRDSAERVILKR